MATDCQSGFKQRMDLTGQTFGCLTAIRRVGRKHNTSIWLCRCECGSEREYTIGNLRSGLSTGCSLCRGERMRAKNGHVRQNHPEEYRIWAGMIARCTNSKLQSWKYYGGRGITVCDRWQASFNDFFADMGARPSSKHSLDRIDNNGNYEPGNVRWATHAVQASNRRERHDARILRFNGEAKPLAQWAKELGLTRQALHQRLQKLPVERALAYSKGDIPYAAGRPPKPKKKYYTPIMSHEERRERWVQIAHAVVRHNDIHKAADEFGVTYPTARSAFEKCGGKVVPTYVLPITEGVTP